jgi:hypothetical protein
MSIENEREAWKSDEMREDSHTYANDFIEESQWVGEVRRERAEALVSVGGGLWWLGRWTPFSAAKHLRCLQVRASRPLPSFATRSPAGWTFSISTLVPLSVHSGVPIITMGCRWK